MEKRLKSCSFSDQPLPVGRVDQLFNPASNPLERFYLVEISKETLLQPFSVEQY